jgi:hypothetical protein
LQAIYRFKLHFKRFRAPHALSGPSMRSGSRIESDSIASPPVESRPPQKLQRRPTQNSLNKQYKCAQVVVYQVRWPVRVQSNWRLRINVTQFVPGRQEWTQLLPVCNRLVASIDV